MRERVKNWKAIHHPPTMFNMVVAPNRREAVIVSRHMAPVAECGARPRRRRLIRGRTWRDPLQQMFAFERSLIVPEVRPLRWYRRLWEWVLSFFRRRHAAVHIIGGSRPWGKQRKGPRWETPTRCHCGSWCMWPTPGGREPNWCPDCEAGAKARIRGWKQANS